MVAVLSKLLSAAGVGLLVASNPAEARLGGRPERALQAATPGKVANIGATLQGLDLLTFDPMNPAGQSMKEMIFKGEYSDEQVTTDGRWLVPDGMEIVSNLNCKTQATTSLVTGEESLKKSSTNKYSFKAGGGVGPVKGSVQNSNTFKKVSESTNTERKSFSFTEMSCKLYKIKLQTSNLPSLSTNFVKSFNAIRPAAQKSEQLAWDSSAVTDFVTQWGTHYVTSSSLGSRHVESYESTYENTQRLKSSTTSIEVGAEVTVWGNTAGTDYLNEHEKTQKKSFESLTTQSSSQSIGAKPPRGTTAEEVTRSWVEETQKSESLQMVDDLELDGLDNLFASNMLPYINENLKREGFNAMTAAELKQINEALHEGISNICETKGLNCADPSKDVPTPPPAKVTNFVASELFGNGGGGNFFGQDPWKTFGQAEGKYTSDIYVSRVDLFYTEKDSKYHVMEGVQHFFKDSQGREQAGKAGATTPGSDRCGIEIPEGVKVGSIDIRSDTWIRYIEIRDDKGKKLGGCGNQNAGTLHTVNFAQDEIFQGFAGYGDKYIDRIQVQKAQITVEPLVK
jgi:hypothetical protein